MGTTNGMDPGGGKSLLQNNALIQWSLGTWLALPNKVSLKLDIFGTKMANLNNFWP